MYGHTLLEQNSIPSDLGPGFNDAIAERSMDLRHTLLRHAGVKLHQQFTLKVIRPLGRTATSNHHVSKGEGQNSNASEHLKTPLPKRNKLPDTI
jgi:hypothetical protein